MLVGRFERPFPQISEQNSLSMFVLLPHHLETHVSRKWTAEATSYGATNVMARLAATSSKSRLFNPYPRVEELSTRSRMVNTAPVNYAMPSPTAAFRSPSPKLC